MAACMFLEAQKTPGVKWTKAALDKEIDELNTSVDGNARVGSWRRRAISNIVLGMTEEVFEILQDHYRQYTWERSCLNEELLRDPCCWNLDQRLPKARGEWQKVYTMSGAAMKLLAEAQVKSWERQWPKDRVRAASVKDVQCARVTSSAPGDDAEVSGSVRAALMACLLTHWLIPKAEAEYGPQSQGALVPMWIKQDPGLLEDLQAILPARMEPTSYALITLASLHAVSAALSKVKTPAPGGATERLDLARDMVRAWASTQEAIKQDKARQSSGLQTEAPTCIECETAWLRAWLLCPALPPAGCLRGCHPRHVHGGCPGVLARPCREQAQRPAGRESGHRLLAPAPPRGQGGR